MNLANGLDSIKVVHTRINANLVQDGNASILGRSVKLSHRRRHITCSDDMSLALDCRPDNVCVIDERNERDYKVVFGNVAIQIGGFDVEGDGSCIGSSGYQLLGRGDCTTTWTSAPESVQRSG